MNNIVVLIVIVVFVIVVAVGRFIVHQLKFGCRFFGNAVDETFVTFRRTSWRRNRCRGRRFVLKNVNMFFSFFYFFFNFFIVFIVILIWIKCGRLAFRCCWNSRCLILEENLHIKLYISISGMYWVKLHTAHFHHEWYKSKRWARVSKFFSFWTNIMEIFI